MKFVIATLCNYAECHHAEFCVLFIIVKSNYAECCYTECLYAECHGALFYVVSKWQVDKKTYHHYSGSHFHFFNLFQNVKRLGSEFSARDFW